MHSYNDNDTVEKFNCPFLEFFIVTDSKLHRHTCMSNPD